MIQDIAPHSFCNRFLQPNSVSPEDYILFFKDEKLMMLNRGTEPDLPKRKDLTDLANTNQEVFLFTLNGCNCFLLRNYTNWEQPHYTFEEISFFRTFRKKEIAWISVVGNQLMSWYSQNRYCGKCGQPTVLKTTERAILCSGCGNTVYPKISPAIIVGITSGDKILLARGVNFRLQFFSLVAGYADIGESLEDTVRREVKEEVGIDITNIRYYKSQPWPFSGSMMIGFWAEADETQPIIIEESEITEAAWFSRDKLPNHPTNISIAGEMIELFEKNQHC
jgi:NAD+ diphosphatase